MTKLIYAGAALGLIFSAALIGVFSVVGAAVLGSGSLAGWTALVLCGGAVLVAACMGAISCLRTEDKGTACIVRRFGTYPPAYVCGSLAEAEAWIDRRATRKYQVYLWHRGRIEISYRADRKERV